MSTIDRAWRDLEFDALASDGRITDADVKNAIKRHRARIEAAAVAASQLADDARLVAQWHDAVDRMPDELRAELRSLAATVGGVLEEGR